VHHVGHLPRIVKLHVTVNYIELISYEAISTRYYECVSVTCLSYPACKSHLFCTALYGHRWPVSTTRSHNTPMS